MKLALRCLLSVYFNKNLKVPLCLGHEEARSKSLCSAFLCLQSLDQPRLAMLEPKRLVNGFECRPAAPLQSSFPCRALRERNDAGIRLQLTAGCSRPRSSRSREIVEPALDAVRLNETGAFPEPL